MPNYLELVGCHYDNAQAYVPDGADPTIYGDLIWITTPISQAELDAQPPCPSAEIDLSNFYAESNAGSTTTATAWQEKVALNWNALDADYLIEWTAEVRVQNSNRRIGVRCRADDTTLINSIFINPSRTSGDWGPVGGFAKLTLPAGAHKINIDFRSSTNGALVRIRNARIKVTQAV